MKSERLRKKAEENNLYRMEHFAEEIKHSVHDTSIYGGNFGGKYVIGDPRAEIAKTEISMKDIKQYLFTELDSLDGKTAVLNFASYKNPGGGYMSGMMAQEEALCHCSTLYEVISRQKQYYEWNNEHKNKGLYCNRVLYSPNIILLDDNNKPCGKFDVITCAAPNNSLGQRYGNFTEEACHTVFYQRTQFMMHMAAYNNVDNLILGAWGCGVFKNDPEFVADTMYTIQKLYNGYFRKVVYAIPKGENYYTFLRVAARM